jgi:hypothetical protein
MMRFSAGTRVVCNVCIASLFAAVARAQGWTGSVRVRVVDSAGSPLAGADIRIQRGADLLAVGVADEAGTRTFSIPNARGEYSVFVRRIGFTRVDRVVRISSNDAVSLTVVLDRTALELGPVKVVSSELTAKQRAYSIDAKEIAESSRPLFDVNDVIHKLRPQIWRSRAPEVCDATPSAPWPAVSAVWVNGRRIPIFKQYVGNHPDSKWVREQVANILHGIKPEHVAELHYHDCFDTSLSGIDATSALYIVLKPGIDFSYGRGSYATMRGQGTAESGFSLEPTPRSSLAPEGFAAYRHRILGVFDGDGGAPLAGVLVLDVNTGVRTVTPETGAVSLWFLPEGSSTLRLTKGGYAEKMISVSIAASDTVPITLLLDRLARP